MDTLEIKKNMEPEDQPQVRFQATDRGPHKKKLQSGIAMKRFDPTFLVSSRMVSQASNEKRAPGCLGDLLRMTNYPVIWGLFHKPLQGSRH